ncbi:TetR/AcrR family transcriptional regulator [Microbacterium sp. NC79]|uniref:TetR/AcrR family transcriptional regulator n=1 Tax=Microbacterium sp. NC79 TaxID=2851009 RepID=UPI001C2BBB6D|nr:TetR/AcrR family transcriptional regulator [Microbacterium sp. NC79]MBV0894669.1 TetR/AcrR family transcriptional regulator [Microbacterium sp. NC79]
MEPLSKQGRPKASSRETLSEAACELFLEKGYDATSVSDITARAGVSRSSFFNYFAAKSDVIWSGFDERVERLVSTLSMSGGGDASSDIREAILAFADGFAPDALALVMSNATAMDAEADLEREGSLRMVRIATAMSMRLARANHTELQAAILGAAYAGGMLAATHRWALDGSGRALLSDRLAEAVAAVEALAA